MVFNGVIDNLPPSMTMLVAYCMMKESITGVDILLPINTFVGVTIITMGFTDKKSKIG